MMNLFAGPCPVCGGSAFTYQSVLWPDLIKEWQISAEEVAYINRQQGFSCNTCHNNMRTLALAAAVLRAYGHKGTLYEFCSSSPNLNVLEINPAGNLSKYLSQMPAHWLIEYPSYDMMDLNIKSNQLDLVIHSDSLEHVPDPEIGLAECRRVLRDGGLCIFTVPVIVGRMTRTRAGLVDSYHGNAEIKASDQIVHTEFGADIWQYILRAGFSSVEIVSLEYPAGMAFVARK